MDLIALYNTLQKLITPESHTSLEHTSAQRIWPSSFTPREQTSAKQRDQTTGRAFKLDRNGWRKKKKEKRNEKNKCLSLFKNPSLINHSGEELMYRRWIPSNITKWGFTVITCRPGIFANAAVFSRAAVFPALGDFSSQAPRLCEPFCGPLNGCSSSSEGRSPVHRDSLPHSCLLSFSTADLRFTAGTSMRRRSVIPERKS